MAEDKGVSSKRKPPKWSALSFSKKCPKNAHADLCITS